MPAPKPISSGCPTCVRAAHGFEPPRIAPRLQSVRVPGCEVGGMPCPSPPHGGNCFAHILDSRFCRQASYVGRRTPCVVRPCTTEALKCLCKAFACCVLVVLSLDCLVPSATAQCSMPVVQPQLGSDSAYKRPRTVFRHHAPRQLHQSDGSRFAMRAKCPAHRQHVAARAVPRGGRAFAPEVIPPIWLHAWRSPGRFPYREPAAHVCAQQSSFLLWTGRRSSNVQQWVPEHHDKLGNM